MKIAYIISLFLLLSEHPHPQQHSFLSILHVPSSHLQSLPQLFPRVLVHIRSPLRGQFTARPKQKNDRSSSGQTHHHNVVTSSHPWKIVTTPATNNTTHVFMKACFHIHANKMHRPLPAKTTPARSPAIHGATGNTRHPSSAQRGLPAIKIVRPKKNIIVPHPKRAILTPRRLQLVHSFIIYW